MIFTTFISSNLIVSVLILFFFFFYHVLAVPNLVLLGKFFFMSSSTSLYKRQMEQKNRAHICYVAKTHSGVFGGYFMLPLLFHFFLWKRDSQEPASYSTKPSCLVLSFHSWSHPIFDWKITHFTLCQLGMTFVCLAEVVILAF